MPKQSRAEFNVDAIGRMGKQIRTQDAKDCFEQGDRDKADRKHLQSAQAAMHKHLVDDYLEK